MVGTCVGATLVGAAVVGATVSATPMVNIPPLYSAAMQRLASCEHASGPQLFCPAVVSLVHVEPPSPRWGGNPRGRATILQYNNITII